MDTASDLVTAATALGAALAGGAFLAFSAFVLQGLDETPPGTAVAAMQGINRRAVTPLFMLTIFGTALLAAALAVLAVTGRGSALAGLAAGVYLVGAVGVTVAGNVPLNGRLARLDAGAAAGGAPVTGAGRAPAVPALDLAAEWHRYRSRWLVLNHVRALSSALAAGALLTTLGA